MPDKSPPSLYTQQVPDKGTGLFTSRTIHAGELVFHIDRPLLCVPDNRCLNEVCYHCFVWLPGGMSMVDGITTKLQVCTGCKVVRYCSKVGGMSSIIRPWLRVCTFHFIKSTIRSSPVSVPFYAIKEPAV